MNKVIKTYIILLSMLLASILLVGCGTKTIDLAPFITISVDGYSERAVANVKFDYDAFRKVVEENSNKNQIEDMLKLMELNESISVKLSKSEEIENGDKLIATVSWDNEVAKKYKLKFTGSEKELVVSDLKTLEKVDLFAEIAIEYEGVAPKARASVRNASSNAFLKNVSYSLDNNNNLANGDSIKVVANVNIDRAESQGVTFEISEKEFIVLGIDEYVSEYSHIDEETLEKLDKQSRDIIGSELADRYSSNADLYPENLNWRYNHDSVNIKSIDLYETYFLNVKAGANTTLGFANANNAIFIVYKVTFTSNVTEGEEDVVYLPIQYNNIIKRDTGAIDVVITNGMLSRAKSGNYDNLYRDIVTVNKANYECEEISHKQ